MPNDPFIDSAALSPPGPVRYLDARDQTAFGAGHAPNAVRVSRRLGQGDQDGGYRLRSDHVLGRGAWFPGRWPGCDRRDL
jgi:hypothetical protein